MTVLRIRPLVGGEGLPHGLLPIWGAPIEVAALDRRAATWVIERGREAIGLAVGWNLPRGVRIDALAVLPGLRELVIETLARSAGGDHLEVAIAVEPSPDLAAVLGRFGLVRLQRNVEVRGALQALQRPTHRPFTFLPAAQVGMPGLVRLLTEIWSSGSTPTHLSPRDELDRLIWNTRDDAGYPSVANWRVAYLDGHAAGVVLSLCPPGHDVGMFSYIGLVPALRGRGLGRALHDEGRWHLCSLGASIYEDSTSQDNAPMLRLLERAGCSPVGHSSLFVAGGAVSAGAQAPCPELAAPLWGGPEVGRTRSQLAAPARLLRRPVSVR